MDLNLRGISILLIIIGFVILFYSIFYYTFGSAWDSLIGDPLLCACVKGNTLAYTVLGVIGGAIPINHGIIGLVRARRKTD